ncbi:MAG: rhomboid family intramembrane serine protease [Candidatus Eisenbacteria bacterium]|nr:rhomboid family intramembrane serine protease [Candidatus Eisenbacteria bacterium]
MYYFFYIPVGTELPVRKPAPAVIGLTTLNVLWFLLFTYCPPLAARMPAMAFDASHPLLVNSITACFIHADWFHLFGNMVFLATLGPALEDRVGSGRFLLLYLACGMIGMAVQAEAWHLGILGAGEPLILGASGAIAGILGLFVIRCGFARIQVAHVTLALVQGQARAGTSPVNGYLAVALWGFLQCVYAMVSQVLGGSPTAYAAHLGGLGAGILLGLGLGLHAEARTESLWLRARRYSQRGDYFAALGDVLAYLTWQPKEADAWLEAARLQRLLKRHRDATRSWFRGIVLFWIERRRHEAVLAARELRRHYPGARLRPSILYRLGLFLERQGDLGWASHTFEDYAHYYPTHDRAPRALVRAARLEARLRNDLPRSRTLYELVTTNYPLASEAVIAADEIKRIDRITTHRNRVA